MTNGNGFDLGKMLNDSTLSGTERERKLRKIPLEQIAPSNNNKYPIEDVEELAYLIETYGLIHPISILRIGKDKYKISSGERRYQAHVHLGLNEIEAVIEDDVEDVNEERIRLIVANTARHKTPEVIQMEVNELVELYDLQKSQGKIKKGTLKRDWIAQLLGYRDGRSIQPYLTSDVTEEIKVKKEIPMGMKELKQLQNILYQTQPTIEEIINRCEPEVKELLLKTMNDLSESLAETYNEHN